MTKITKVTYKCNNCGMEMKYPSEFAGSEPCVAHFCSEKCKKEWQNEPRRCGNCGEEDKYCRCPDHII